MHFSVYWKDPSLTTVDLVAPPSCRRHRLRWDVSFLLPWCTRPNSPKSSSETSSCVDFNHPKNFIFSIFNLYVVTRKGHLWLVLFLLCKKKETKTLHLSTLNQFWWPRQYFSKSWKITLALHGIDELKTIQHNSMYETFFTIHWGLVPVSSQNNFVLI